MSRFARWRNAFVSALILLAAVDTSSLSAAEADWKSYVIDEAALAFQLPGVTTRTMEGATIRYAVQADAGETVYEVRLVPVADAATLKTQPQASFDAMRDAVAANMKGKVLDEKAVELGGNPGREVMLKTAGDVVVRLRFQALERGLLIAQAVTTPKSTAGPADLNRFFNSFHLDAKSTPAATASPTTAVAPATAKTEPVAGSTAGHAAFVDCVAARDGKRLYEMMHPKLQAIVDPPLLQMFLDVVAEELGPVTLKQTPAFRAVSEETATSKAVRATDNVGFKNGTFETTTIVADGKLAGFNIAAPPLAQVDQLLYRRIAKLLDSKSEQLRPVVEFYAAKCANFVITLIGKGEREAYALLDPKVQAELTLAKIGPDLIRIRNELAGTVGAGLQDFRLVADADKVFQQMQVDLGLERPGKQPVRGRLVLKIDNFHAVITGYEFTEPVPMPNAAAPATNTPPTSPVAAQPTPAKNNPPTSAPVVP
jgi:hypothetical protein